MTNLEIVLAAMRRLGREDALDLRWAAKDLDGTAIIDREQQVPAFDPEKDYSSWPVGAPVADEGQVWTLLQPYNAAAQSGRPATLRALWGLCHTKDPDRAKPFVAPYGTSGLYMEGECILWQGRVMRCTQDATVHDPEALPQAWEEAGG